MWLASDHRCSDTASGQAPSNQTKDINKFIHNGRNLINAKNFTMSISSGGSRGGSGVSTEPPFLAGYVINLICTVKDPGFMEPPFLPFSYNKTYLFSVFEKILLSIRVHFAACSKHARKRDQNNSIIAWLRVVVCTRLGNGREYYAREHNTCIVLYGVLRSRFCCEFILHFEYLLS